MCYIYCPFANLILVFLALPTHTDGFVFIVAGFGIVFERHGGIEFVHAAIEKVGIESARAASAQALWMFPAPSGGLQDSLSRNGLFGYLWHPSCDTGGLWQNPRRPARRQFRNHNPRQPIQPLCYRPRHGPPTHATLKGNHTHIHTKHTKRLPLRFFHYNTSLKCRQPLRLFQPILLLVLLHPRQEEGRTCSHHHHVCLASILLLLLLVWHGERRRS